MICPKYLKPVFNTPSISNKYRVNMIKYIKVVAAASLKSDLLLGRDLPSKLRIIL